LQRPQRHALVIFQNRRQQVPLFHASARSFWRALRHGCCSGARRERGSCPRRMPMPMAVRMASRTRLGLTPRPAPATAPPA
jgi:hypothetical protein